MAEDEVELAVCERQLLRVAGARRHGQAERARGVLERAQHAGREVGADRLAADPGLEQVQAEVAGAGADLEAARERRQATARGERLAHLAEHLRLAYLAVVDAPLGFVAFFGAVVVAGVYGADLVGGR